MGKKISLIILSNGGNRMRQLSIPASLFFILGVVVICDLALVGFFLFDYHVIRQRSAQTLRLDTDVITDLQNEIARQQTHLQFFDSQIIALKSRLTQLHQFEKQIRSLANLPPPPDDIHAIVDAQPPVPSDPTGESLPAPDETDDVSTPLIQGMKVRVRILDTASDDTQRRFEALAAELEGKRNLITATPAIRPTSGWITSRFGTRISPFTDQEELHQGLDIANRTGTEVIATGDGVISFVGKKGGMGNMLTIDHGYGMVTRYAHLSEFLKKAGDTVKRGDIIAYMGNSGRSTGPHLHYEIQLNGILVDPTRYITDWSSFETDPGESGTSPTSPIPTPPEKKDEP